MWFHCKVRRNRVKCGLKSVFTLSLRNREIAVNKIEKKHPFDLDSESNGFKLTIFYPFLSIDRWYQFNLETSEATIQLLIPTDRKWEKHFYITDETELHSIDHKKTIIYFLSNLHFATRRKFIGVPLSSVEKKSEGNKSVACRSATWFSIKLLLHAWEKR